MPRFAPQGASAKIDPVRGWGLLRSHRVAVLAALCGAAAITGVSVLFTAVGPLGPARPGQFATTITVNTSAPAVGSLYDHSIGLSFESGSLNSGQFDAVGNLPQLMRNLGTPVMRFGGDSVDQSFAGITPKALAGLVRLVNATGWSVLYSENLGHYNQAIAVQDARAVAKALDRHLAGLACGNEPNYYAANGRRAPSYQVSDYLGEEDECLAAIHAAAPSAPLEGPDIPATSQWLTASAADERGSLAVLGAHDYPMGCGLNAKTPAQWDAALLSSATTAVEVSAFKAAMADATSAMAPLWFTETNNACGGGAMGASDTYATALWVVSYILTGAENGVAEMSFHGSLNPGPCRGYTPLCEVGANEYAAQPIYYGMLFAHLLGSGRLLPVTLTPSPASPDMSAYALSPGGGGGTRVMTRHAIRVMIVNPGNNAANVTLRVGGGPARATVLHLTGPAVGLLGTSGTEIQGASVAANGTIRPGAPDSVACSSGGCHVLVPTRAAVLVTVP